MIAFFIPGLYPCFIGGMEIFYHHLMNEFSHEEDIIIFTTCNKIISDKRKKVIYINNRLFFIRRYGFGKLSVILSTIWQVIRNRKKIDIIHIAATSITGYYGLIFPGIKYFFRIPYVVTFHGGGLHPWNRFSFHFTLFKHAKTAIAVSSIIKETLEQRTGRPIKVILPMVPFKKTERAKTIIRKEYDIDSNSTVLLMVGSVKPLKGTMFVVQSFIYLGREYLEEYNLVLVIAGQGEDIKKITQIINENELTSRILLLGNIENERIHEIFSMSDIYIIASEYEGTSKSLVEAMSNGLPIIASNVNGINNIIIDGSNGILFEYNVTNSFITQIKRILIEEELLLNIRIRAYNYYISNFSFEKTLIEYKNVLGN